MNNRTIVKLLPNLRAIRATHAAAERGMKLMTRDLNQSEELLSTLARVTEVFEGVALELRVERTIYGSDVYVTAVDAGIRREAKVYTNAHTSRNGRATEYCLRLVLQPVFIGGSESRKESVHGMSWTPRAKAVLAAKWYVAKGVVPKEHR